MPYPLGYMNKLQERSESNRGLAIKSRRSATELLFRLVEAEGFEPSCLATADFESAVYAVPPRSHLVRPPRFELRTKGL